MNRERGFQIQRFYYDRNVGLAQFIGQTPLDLRFNGEISPYKAEIGFDSRSGRSFIQWRVIREHPTAVSRYNQT